MEVELELYRAVIVLLNVVQVAILAALLRWIRGNGSATAAAPDADAVAAVERYLDAAARAASAHRMQRGLPERE